MLCLYGGQPIVGVEQDDTWISVRSGCSSIAVQGSLRTSRLLHTLPSIAAGKARRGVDLPIDAPRLVSSYPHALIS